MAEPLLTFGGVDTFYGPAQVHFGLTFAVGTGRIVCLLGGNASGKSTAMKVIMGLVRPRAGMVSFDGRSIVGVPTHLVAKRGIGAVPEARRLFPAMTVRENLLMGAYPRADARAVAADYARVLDLFPRLRARLAAQAGTLSGGEQQMAAMARALMGRPKLIVMDEPTMGLSPAYVERVLDLVAAMNRAGTTVLLVEQNAHLALAIAHDAYVLQAGRVVLAGPARELRADPRVRDAYLGGAPPPIPAASAS